MLLDRAARKDSVLQRIDPRVRIVCALAASIAPLAMHANYSIGAMAALGFALCAVARVPWSILFTRLVAVNGFMAMLILLLPWSVEGRTLILFAGRYTYSAEGLVQAWQIALRGNAILLSLTALVSTMEPVVLGHALERLRVPAKLIQLFLFSVRYVAVLEQEYRQLRLAMRVRAFEARFNLHTLRSFGNLVGMLLVRALDRSERVNDAMKCRGFRGIFPSFHDFRLRYRDGAFAPYMQRPRRAGAVLGPGGSRRGDYSAFFLGLRMISFRSQTALADFMTLALSFSTLARVFRSLLTADELGPRFSRALSIISTSSLPRRSSMSNFERNFSIDLRAGFGFFS